MVLVSEVHLYPHSRLSAIRISAVSRFSNFGFRFRNVKFQIPNFGCWHFAFHFAFGALHFALRVSGSGKFCKGHGASGPDCIRTSIYDKYSGSLKLTSHLYHVSHCTTASGTHWSNRWTYRVFVISTRRD